MYIFFFLILLKTFNYREFNIVRAFFRVFKNELQRNIFSIPRLPFIKIHSINQSSQTAINYYEIYLYESADVNRLLYTRCLVNSNKQDKALIMTLVTVISEREREREGVFTISLMRSPIEIYIYIYIYRVFLNKCEKV